jgi:nucleotide-binding universal stress UspA family protein
MARGRLIFPQWFRYVVCMKPATGGGLRAVNVLRRTRLSGPCGGGPALARGRTKPVFTKIMVPVDLLHAARLTRALKVAADLGRLYGAEVCYVAVTAPTPGPAAHNPQEFAAKLDDFARGEGEAQGLPVSSHSVISHDPAVDLDDALLKARKEIGADLVVMASHVPGISDYLFPSHGGKMARRAGVSVMVVREDQTP